MVFRRVLLLGLAVCLVFGGLSVVLADEGNTAPDFELETLGGETITLSDLQGHRVLLDFGASWCGPCRMQKPLIQQLYTLHPEIVVVWVNYMESRDHVEAYMEENGYTFPVVFDADGDVTRAYGVDRIPTNFFVDEEGQIMEVITGVLAYGTVIEIFDLCPV